MALSFPLFVNIEQFFYIDKKKGEYSMQYIKLIRQPSIDMYAGITVDKDTNLEYETENVKQTIKDLVLHSVTTLNGEEYESKYETTIRLNEGDVLVFDENRGYIKPVERFMTVSEAIEELKCVLEVQGGE